MATKKQGAAATADRCPHCRVEKALKPTLKVQKDSDGKNVQVWECEECGYTEGRP